MDFLKRLAETLGVANDVILAARDDNPKAQAQLEAAVERAIEKVRIELNSSREALAAVFSLAEVDNPEAMVEKLTKMVADSAKLQELLPELTAMKEKAKKAEEDEEEKDVEEVMAAHRMSENLKPALLMYRRNDKEAFKAAYPVDKATEYLRTPLVTPEPQSNVHQLHRAPAIPGVGQPIRREPVLAGRDQLPAGASHVGQAITMASGRNPIEKAMNYLLSQPGGKEMSYDDRHIAACELVRNINKGVA